MKRLIPFSSEGRAKARKLPTPNPLHPNRPNRAIPVLKHPKTRNSTGLLYQDYLALNHLTKTNKPKAKPKTPATAYQISATLAPKPKSKARAKKRTQSADGVLKTSHKAGTGKSKTKGSTSDSALPKPKPAKPITIAPRGATIVNRVGPKTFASLDS
jgi:hypothetical protein